MCFDFLCDLKLTELVGQRYGSQKEHYRHLVVLSMFSGSKGLRYVYVLMPYHTYLLTDSASCFNTHPVTEKIHAPGRDPSVAKNQKILPPNDLKPKCYRFTLIRILKTRNSN